MLLEKVYSIWICLDGIPKDLQNTSYMLSMISYAEENGEKYREKMYKEFGM